MREYMDPLGFVRIVLAPSSYPLANSKRIFIQSATAVLLLREEELLGEAPDPCILSSWRHSRPQLVTALNDAKQQVKWEDLAEKQTLPCIDSHG